MAPDERRRQWLIWLAGAGFLAESACARTAVPPRCAPASVERELGEVTPLEDLMNEHGVLRRVLLVYDELSRRARAGTPAEPSFYTRAATIVRDVIEQHHERDEEQYVFPVLRGDRKVGPIITVLLEQHVRGREVTAEILRLAALGPAAGSDVSLRLAGLCDAFARMYHPHAAREDTVVFPALRGVLGNRAMWELGERMEHSPEEETADVNFVHALVDLHRMDIALGLADLSAFTAGAVERPDAG